MSTASAFLAVALGGLFGAPCRFLVDRAVSARARASLPWGTFLVNISGSLLLGLLTGLSTSGQLPTGAKDVLAVGFCGAYTTFSTFSFETLRLLEGGEVLEAALNLGSSLLVGLAAAAAGLGLGLLA